MNSKRLEIDAQSTHTIASEWYTYVQHLQLYTCDALSSPKKNDNRFNVKKMIKSMKKVFKNEKSAASAKAHESTPNGRDNGRLGRKSKVGCNGLTRRKHEMKKEKTCPHTHNLGQNCHANIFQSSKEQTNRNYAEQESLKK